MIEFHCDVSEPACGICDVCRSVRRKNAKSLKAQEHRGRKNDRLRKKAHKKIKQIREMYGKTCYICKIKPGVTIDHVIPISKGGTNEIENLRPACYDCNWEKGDKII